MVYGKDNDLTTVETSGNGSDSDSDDDMFRPVNAVKTGAAGMSTPHTADTPRHFVATHSMFRALRARPFSQRSH